MGPLSTLAVAVAAILSAQGTPGGDAAAVRAEPERLYGRLATLGRSADGRPIRAVRVGNAGAPRKVLVVGVIHGNETAGVPVLRQLRRRPAPRGVELWLVPSINPDGVAAGTRQNARGVDLNRNFPHRWRAQGVPGSTYHSGRRPLSEPEARVAARLIARLRPDVTIWYHQALTLVDLGSGANPALVRRYARLSGLPARRLGFLPGVATRWQNNAQPAGSAFVVELAAGSLTPTQVRRHAGAVRALARPAPPI